MHYGFFDTKKESDCHMLKSVKFLVDPDNEDGFYTEAELTKSYIGCIIFPIFITCVAVACTIGLLIGLGYISSSTKACTNSSCFVDYDTTSLWFWHCMGCGFWTLLFTTVCIVVIIMYIRLWYVAYWDIKEELLYKKDEHDNNIQITSLYARVKDVVSNTFISVDDAFNDTSRDWTRYVTFNPHYKFLPGVFWFIFVHAIIIILPFLYVIYIVFSLIGGLLHSIPDDVERLFGSVPSIANCTNITLTKDCIKAGSFGCLLPCFMNTVIYTLLCIAIISLVLYLFKCCSHCKRAFKMPEEIPLIVAQSQTSRHAHM